MTRQIGSQGNALVSQFLVAPTASQGYYTTIQEALDDANAAGGGTVFVKPGSYTESLTLYDNTQVVGSESAIQNGNLVIIGVHTPPVTGQFAFSNCILQSATHVFSSAVAGTADLIVDSCVIVLTNGYVFNLANWTGELRVNNCIDGSTTNGIVTNTGGSDVVINNSTIGSGTANTCNISGGYSITNATVNCPIVFTGSSTGNITYTNISSGAVAAITQSSSGNLIVASCVINSSAVPAIAGAGAGTIALNRITFLDNHTLSATLTYASTYETLDTSNWTLTNNYSGSTVSGNISNSSNTASSRSQLLLSLAGTTAAAAEVSYRTTGGNTFSHGLINSDGSWTMTNGVDASSGTALVKVMNAGDVSILAGDLFVQSSQVGNNLNARVYNTDATNAASDSLMQTVTSPTGGDPFFLVTIDGSNAYAMGIDNSDSDTWKMTTDIGIPNPSSGTSLMEMTLAGIPSFPQLPGNVVSNTEIVTIDSSTGELGSQSGGTVVFSWTDESGAFSPAEGSGYFITATSTATLPAAPAQGDTISFIVDTTDILTIQAVGTQVIRLGNTVSAAAGTCVSTARGDSITLVYRSTGTAWIALESIGNWTIT